MQTAQITGPQTRRWSYEEYYQMADMGFFNGQRVELIDGEIIQMAPQGNFHAVAVGLGQCAISRIFVADFWVREQLPMRFSGKYSEPEPDVSVVAGEPRDYRNGHPESAVLIIEVSETTLAHDRGHKASLYASAGISDYWIVNLADRQLEVLRNPVADNSQQLGWKYSQVQIFKSGQQVFPLAAPEQSVAESDLLP